MRGSRREVRVLLVMPFVVCSLVGHGSAQADDGPLIQPGAPAMFAHTPLGQFGPCTLNFVFRDAVNTYIGGPGRCTEEVGERVVMENREFGTVVFRVLAAGGPSDPPETIDDFSLVRVDRSALPRVSPVVLDVGRSPARVGTSDLTIQGDPVFFTGAGVVLGGQWPTRHRAGVFISDDARSFHVAIPATLGDAGAPVLHTSNAELNGRDTLGYNALGVLGSPFGAGGAHGTTVPRILQLLQESGFDVELVTGYDEQVRQGGSG